MRLASYFFQLFNLDWNLLITANCLTLPPDLNAKLDILVSIIVRLCPCMREILKNYVKMGGNI